jgi:regulator of protease activity HflC (stomatin/prohibitin superfamily)
MIVQILFFTVFVAVFLAVIAAKSIKKTKEGERLVVFRLGQLHSVCPPGLNVIIPFIDKGMTASDEQIEEWRQLPEEELQRKLVEAGREKSA